MLNFLIPAGLSLATNLIGANQAKKAGQVTAPPPPAPVNPGQAINEYMAGVANDATQNNIITSESYYRPRYVELAAGDVQAGLIGTENARGALDFLGMSADRMAALNQRLATQNVEYQLDQLKSYGPEATAAYMAANPAFARAMTQMEGLGGRQMSGYLNEMGRLAMQPSTGSQINPFAGFGGGGPSAYGTPQQQQAQAFSNAQQALQAQGGQPAAQRANVPPELADRMQALVSQARSQDGVMPGGQLGIAGMPGPVMADQVAFGGTLTPQQVQAQQVQAERVAAERIAAERIAAGQVQAGTVGGGLLGESLYQQALRGQEMSPVSAALQQQALQMAQAPGGITPDEMRAATQGAREGYASSGRLADNASIAGEALARAGASRERQMQNLAAAQQINQQLLGAQQMGQQLATDVLRTDIQRQQANVGTQLQAGQFNVDAALRASLANQSTGLQASMANQDAFLRAAMANQSTGLQASLANQQANLQASLANQGAGMQAGQFNITNAQDVQRMNQAANLQANLANQANQQRGFEFVTGTNLQAQLANRQFGLDELNARFNRLNTTTAMEQNMLGADRAFAAQMAGMYGNITPAALAQAGIGRNADAINMGGQALNAAMALSTRNTPELFSPDAAINLALANQANQANYNAAIAGARGAAAGASANAVGNLYGNMAKTAGSLAGNVNWGNIFNVGTPGINPQGGASGRGAYGPF